MKIKKALYKITTAIKDSNVDQKAGISYFVKFYNSSIGKYSYVSNNCNVFHTDIGNFTSIGLGCNIGGGEHPLDWVSTSPAFQAGRTFSYGFQGHRFGAYKQTVIGSDVWIGANAIIKSGITIADGAVIGAGSVVTKDVGAYEIWAGNPARMIKKRFPDETIARLRKTGWWNWEDEKLAKYAAYMNDPAVFIEKTAGDGDDT